MERRAEVYGIGMREKGRQLLGQSSRWLGRSGIGLLGALLANAELPGGGAPFGIAFAAASPKTLTIPAAVGAAMGYLLYFASGTGIRWHGLFGIILALWIVWGGQMAQIHPRKARFRQEMLFRLLGASFGSVAPALLTRLFTVLTVQDLFLLLSEGTAALGACWMFTRMLRPEGRLESGTLLMTAGLGCAALSHICIGELSVGRMTALLVVLFAAGSPGRKERPGTGTAVGVALGALTALCGVQGGFGYTLPGIWGLGGLLAGVFAPMGQGFLCAALLLGETAAVFLFAQDTGAYVILGEALLAGGIWYFLPAGLRSRLWIQLGGDEAETGGAVGELLLSRLRDTAAALSQIARASDTVAKRLEKKEALPDDTPEHIFRETIQKVCRSCPNGAKCWAGSYGETLDGFGKLKERLQSDGTLTPETAGECFVRGCVRSEQISAQAQRDYHTHQESRKKKHLASRTRSLVTDQFEGMSMMLTEMAGQLRQIHSCPGETEEQIRECCMRSGLEIQKLHCFLDAQEHLTLELTLPIGQWYRLENGKKLTLSELTAQLSAAVLRVLAPPQIQSTGDSASLCWQEQPQYRLQTGSAQLSAESGRVCGDIVTVFTDRERRETLLISDGMGTGTHAAMDAAMTVGILSRLLGAGIGPDAALRLVNSALLIRSEEESLATVDLVQADLYTGQMCFHKAGAAPTYLRRNGRCSSVEADSLPAGILEETAFERAFVTLHTGDMLVMVSDGAVQGDGSWIYGELERAGMQDPQKLAEHLVRCARAHTEGRADDITVLVALLTDA